MFTAQAPPRLKSGDKVLLIAPANSLSSLSGGEQIVKNATDQLAKLGLELVPAPNISAKGNSLKQMPVEERLADLHLGFSDPQYAGVMALVGGSSGSMLLPGIQYRLIAKNPKVFIGHSDTAVLCNAITNLSGVMTYYGPSAFNLGQKAEVEYSLNSLAQCLTRSDSYQIFHPDNFVGGSYTGEVEDMEVIGHNGWTVINEGYANGVVVGGNLPRVALLQGDYMPDLSGSILWLEGAIPADQYDLGPYFTSLSQKKGYPGIRGIVFGRFKTTNGAKLEHVRDLVKTCPVASRVPVIANVDFGHTEPKITIPIGGSCVINGDNQNVTIKIVEH